MSDKFSQLLPVLGAIVAFLLAALLLVYIVRLVFGRRIRAPGPRNRPRRMDIVEVFDLDKERQLVIVRRDNTEHLLLIGGPNDLLVEGAINRVESIVGRADPGRAEATRPAPPQNWPAAPVVEDDAAPVPIKPAAPSGINLPPEMVAPKPPPPKPPAPKPAPQAPRPAAPPPTAETAAPPPPASAAPQPPGQAAPPLPPRPTPAAPPPLRPAPGQRPAPPPFLARTQQVIKPRADEAGAPAEPETRSAPPPPPRPAPPLRPSVPPPPPVRPTAPEGTSPSGDLPRPPTPQARPGVPPLRPEPPPPPTPPAPPSRLPEGGLESLEEEMARLLGRPEKE